MFLHPRQVEAAMRGLSGVVAYRFVVDRVAHRDMLRCEVVPASGADTPGLAEQISTRVRSGLRFDAEVVIVDTLPEGAGVIDDQRDWS